MPSRLAPGLIVTLAIAGLATLCGSQVPVIGAPVFAILIGLALSAVGLPRSWRVGSEFAAKRVLQAGVVVLGLELSLRQVVVTGWTSLPVLVGTLGAALAGAALVGRWLGLRWDLKVLVGVGTAICGASAIAATDAVIGAAEADVAYAIATIFTFNVVAVLTYPLLGHLMGLSQHAFGLWAGTAINDTSSVVAAAGNYGTTAASVAVVVKLTRTLAIIPISLVLASWADRRRAGAALQAAPTAARLPEHAAVGASAGAGAGSAAAPGGGADGPLALLDESPAPAQVVPRPRSPLSAARRAVPGFLLLFLAAVACNSVGIDPVPKVRVNELATFLVTMALAGIGCSARVRELRRVGARPLLLGAALWAVVGLTSLALQGLTGSL